MLSLTAKYRVLQRCGGDGGSLAHIGALIDIAFFLAIRRSALLSVLLLAMRLHIAIAREDLVAFWTPELMRPAMLFHSILSFKCLVAFWANDVSAHVHLTMVHQVGFGVEGPVAFWANVLSSLPFMVVSRMS